MRMYDYLVTYTFNKEGYLSQCGGDSCISRKKKIKIYDDISEVRKLLIESIQGSSNMSINNIVFLGRNKH
jgi:hypothetical protein